MSADHLRHRRPRFVTLVLLELRKAVDTRSGRALLAVMIGIAAAIMIGGVVLADDGPALPVATLIGTALLPSFALLPIIGVMLSTSEWSQRSAMSTFTLVPGRGRVLLAKLVAALVLVVSVILGTLLIAALAIGVAMVTTDLQIDPTGLAQTLRDVAAGVLTTVLFGVGVGAATLSTPISIVIVLLVPIVLDPILRLALPLVSDYLAYGELGLWLGGSAALHPAVLTSALIWFVAPVLLGILRYRTADVH